MIFWGLLLIAIGVGALLDISLWPLVFIIVGAALLLPIITGARRYGGLYDWWCCSWQSNQQEQQANAEATEHRP